MTTLQTVPDTDGATADDRHVVIFKGTRNALLRDGRRNWQTRQDMLDRVQTDGIVASSKDAALTEAAGFRPGSSPIIAVPYAAWVTEWDTPVLTITNPHGCKGTAYRLTAADGAQVIVDETGDVYADLAFQIDRAFGDVKPDDEESPLLTAARRVLFQADQPPGIVPEADRRAAVEALRNMIPACASCGERYEALGGEHGYCGTCRESAFPAEETTTTEQTWTFVGHWENDEIVVEYVVPGDYQDPRVDTGRWPEGLFASSATATTREVAEALVRVEYENLDTIVMTDQPTDCPQCQHRTPYVDLPDGTQLHDCNHCGHRFIVAQDFDGEEQCDSCREFAPVEVLEANAGNCAKCAAGPMCSQCHHQPAEDHGMCGGCLHDAYRSGWVPGEDD